MRSRKDIVKVHRTGGRQDTRRRRLVGLALTAAALTMVVDPTLTFASPEPSGSTPSTTDALEPDDTAPDSSVPEDATEPDSSVPENATAPDTTAPDPSVPEDATAPDMTVPDATVPDATAPEDTTTPRSTLAPTEASTARTTSAVGEELAAPGEPEIGLLATSPFECAVGAPGYLFQYPTGTPTQGYTVDIVSGAADTAFSVADRGVNAIGYNVLDNYIYGWDTEAAAPTMVRVSADGTTDDLGVPAGVVAESTLVIGDVDENGHYWFASPVSGRWYQVDLDSASATYFTVLSSGTISPWPSQPDWAFVPGDNALYSVGTVAGESVLRRFGRTSHTFTNLGALGVGGDIVSGAMYADADGFLYTSNNAGGDIYRIDVDAVTAEYLSTGPESAANDGARCHLASIPIDFGDADDGYGTTLGADGPRHGIPGYDAAADTAPLMLGATIDVETDGVPTADASGDDAADTDDEDGVADPIVLIEGAETTVTVSVTNTTAGPATLAGWIDLDASGTFDAGELQTIVVSDSGDYDLTFPAATGSGDRSARFRVFAGDVTDPLPTGAAAAGEVEDYPVTGPIQPQFECATNAAGLLIQQAPADLFEIDLVTGEFDVTADDFYPANINAVGYNVLDNYIYGFLPLAPQQMVRIGSDGSVVELGLPAGVPAINHNTGDVDENGQYWLSTQNAGGADSGWRQIDLAPGSTSYGQVIASGPITGDGIETYRNGPDWAYVPGGGDYLYRVMSNVAGSESFLFRFNRTSHLFENLGSLGDLGAGNVFGAVYADADGYLYASNNNSGEIFRIDVQDATATKFSDGPPSTGNDGTRCVLSSILLDFGDAPDSYSTLLAADGPRHGIPGYDEATNTAPLMLGDENTIDPETDGFPGAAADGDDGDGVDDEGAVAEPVTMTAGQPLSLTATATNVTTEDATLAGWVDLDGNGTFDAAELVTTTVPAGSGSADYPLDFPAGTTTTDTYLRLRLFPGAVTDPLPTGPASAGEVEDHLVVLAEIQDFGDAPDSYGTTLADDGARHSVVGGDDALRLGLLVDAEDDGLPTTGADGDDLDGLDDEDGVQFNTDVSVPGRAETVWVTASDVGFLNAWIDFDLSGTFDANERIATDTPVIAGSNRVEYTVPTGVDFATGESYARFRLTTAAGEVTGPTGPAADGEVEDHTRTLYDAPSEVLECPAGSIPVPVDLIQNPSFESRTQDFQNAPGNAANTINFAENWYDSHTTGGQYLYIDPPTFDSGPTEASGNMPARAGADGAAFLGGHSSSTGGSPVGEGATSTLFVPMVPGARYVGYFSITAGGFQRDGDGYVEFFGVSDPSIGSVPQGGVIAPTATNSELLYTTPVTEYVGDGERPTWELTTFELVADQAWDYFRVEVRNADPAGNGSPATQTWVNFDDFHMYLCEPQMDFGDAPDTYGTVRADDGASHIVMPGLNLGEQIDVDADGQPTELADGDDTTDLDDEDGVAAAIVVTAGQPTAVTVSATNTTDEPATLAGWIDLDGSGTFDAGELQMVTVPAGSATADYELLFPAGTPTAATYARFRLFPGEVAEPLPTGAAAAGEVEDYPVTVTSLHVEKSSDPVERTPVAPGDVVTYTVRVRNDGPVAITDTIVDDLTNVIDDATYNGNATVNIGDVTYTVPELTWTGTLQPGEEAVITYSVTVFGGNGSELTTITALDTPNRQNADGWAVTAYNLDPGCATLNPPDGTLPFPAIWGDQYAWFGEGLAPRADQTVGGAGCYTTWPGYDAAPNSWVLTKTFESPEDAVATVLSTGFRGDGGARVRINGVDAGIYGQWNLPAVDGTAQIPVTAGTNTIEIEVRDINGVNLVQGRLDIQIVQLGDNMLENVVTGADCPTPPITDPEDPNYDPDCHNLVPVNRIDVSKAVTSGPTPLGDGQYEVGYTITVLNSGAAEGTYDLDDALQYGAGISVASASIVNTTPGDVAINAGWNGQSDTVVATGVPIAGTAGTTPAVHTYVVTAVVDVPPGTSAEAADCMVGPGESGSGAFNTATMTTAGVPSEADACAELPTTEFDKELTSVTSNGDGTFTLVYALTVARTGGDGTYDLDDTLRYGDAVTVDSVTASNTTPGTVTTNPAFDGVGDTLVVGDAVIGQGETHSYEVVVQATVDGATVTFENSDCELGDGETGTGFSNEATIDIDGTEYTDTACEPIPATTVIKEITSGPTAIGDGQYELTYAITVTNQGAGDDVYDVTDELTYGDGVDVVSAEAVNSDPGDITTEPTWDGLTATTVVADQPIDGATADGPAVHGYTVTVVFTAPATITDEAADCVLEGGEDGTGLRNETTVTGQSGSATDEDCAEVPHTDFDKQLASVVANGDGTHTLTYELTVGQSGADATYDLADALMINEATTVESVTAASVTPGDIVTNGDFDGDTDTLVVGGVDIADGDVHVYEIAVVVTVRLGDVTPENSDCVLTPGESGTGAMNQATLTVNGADMPAEACEPFPATTVAKGIADGPTAIGGGRYEISYTITATNYGAGDDVYTLTDELTYGDGITVVSAAITATDPAVLVTDPTWNGLGATTIVADQPIAGSTPGALVTHTYTVTVVVDAPVDLVTDAADCTLGGGENGTGLLNTVALSGQSGESTDDECAELPITEFDKTLESVIGNGDGTYTLNYELTVTRTGDGPVYDLNDTLRYGAAVTIESVDAANTAPGDIVTNADFDGVSDDSLASSVDIADGETHVYAVTVVASVEATEITLANSDCELTTDESGTGFLNSATMTTNESTITDDVCEPPPAEPLVDKAVVEGPTPIGGGQYEIVYSITATNPGAGIGVYSLDDELRYGDGIEVAAATVENTVPGDISVNSAWDGIDDTNVVSGQPIEAATADGAAVHTFTVTVVADVALDIPADAADCQAGPGGEGSGFLNVASLTVNGDTGEAEACEAAPTTSFDKELVDVVANGDGTYTLDYELTVTRTGDGPAYTLTDELQYGDAITVDEVTAVNTTPGSIVTNAGFDGVTDTVVAADVAIADGTTHVYTITVEATVDAEGITFENSDCELANGESGTGFHNTAGVTSNDSTISDTACDDPSAVLVDKEVTSGPTPLGDGTFEVVYTITATNNGAGVGDYTLTDQLRFGDGIAVASADVANTDPGDIIVDPGWNGADATTVVADQAIAGATADGPTTHTYTVTVVVEVPADLAPAAGDCELGGDEDGTGLRNDAAITGDSGPSTDTDCAEPPVNDFDKVLVDITSLGDRQFELVYELTATRVSGGDGTYTLEDHLMPGESLTIEGVTATNAAPGDVAINDGFDGVADTVVAADVGFTNGDVHVYRIAVVVTVDVDAVTPGNSDCELTQGEDGTGAMNQAGLDVDGVVDEAETCEEFPNVTVLKDVLEGPTALGDGTYGITYEITVMNSGAGDDVYDLDDELHYGEGITVVSTELTNELPGDIAVNDGWNGADDVIVVAGEPIAGADDVVVVHTYRVDVVVEVAPGTAVEAADCVIDPGEDGTGLLNRATMSVGGDVDEAEACEDPPITDPLKEIVSVTSNGDGTTTLVYDITVTRRGDGPGYDLDDELAYSDAVTVESVTVANTAPGGIVTNAGFDGVRDITIVTDAAIADGESHVYRMTVVAAVDESAVTYENSTCEAGSDGAGTGFLNTVAVTSNDITNTAAACEPIAGLVVDKEVTTGPIELADDRFEVVYTITVANNGAGAGVYDLDDQFAFAEGVTIVSAHAVNAAPGDITVDPDWNGQDEPTLVTEQAIAGATGPDSSTVHTYTVTVVVDVATGVTLQASDCVDDPGEPGTGFLNTATMTVDGEETTADACTAIPLEEELHVEKVVDATIVSLGDTLTYTVEVTNIGTIDYTTEYPAELIDDLTDVLDDAVWARNATATAGAVSYAAPNLTWTGPLAVGDTVTLTYAVTVNSTATGSGALYNTVGVSSGGGSNCPVGTPAAECETTTLLRLPPPPPAPIPPITPGPLPVTG